jgi:hypothetical protein
MIEITVLRCFSLLFVVFCDLLSQMEHSIGIVQVPGEEVRLGGEEQLAVQERTDGVERQVAALICRNSAAHASWGAV